MAGRSMKEVIESGKLKTFFDPRLIRAVGHPMREHVLAVFNERIASGSEIGEEIGADVSSFYHHIEELEKLGCIERVTTKRRRGAKEHFFRATATAVFDDRAWRQLPASLKADLRVGFIQSILNDVVVAFAAGTFNARHDDHVSWTPGRFDALGWSEVKALMDETLKRVLEIQRKSAERLAKRGEMGTPATIGILGFEAGNPAAESAAG